MPTSDKKSVTIAEIARGVGLAENKAAPNDKDRLEDNSLEARRYQAETNTIHQRNRDRRANRLLRARYAKAVYFYLVIYSSFAGLVVLLSGFNICGFLLPSSVLTALVGSTAVSAIGLVATVVAGLFTFAPKDPN